MPGKQCIWKVTLGVSAEKVKAKRADGDGIFYVDANSVDQAIRKAMAAYQRIVRAEKRAEWISCGLCTRCGDIRSDDATVWCNRCLVIQRNRHKTRVGKKHLIEAVPTKRSDTGREAELLLSVYDAWLKARNNKEFSNWLTSRLYKLGVYVKRTA